MFDKHERCKTLDLRYDLFMRGGNQIHQSGNQLFFGTRKSRTISKEENLQFDQEAARAKAAKAISVGDYTELVKVVKSGDFQTLDLFFQMEDHAYDQVVYQSVSLGQWETQQFEGGFKSSFVNWFDDVCKLDLSQAIDKVKNRKLIDYWPYKTVGALTFANGLLEQNPNPDNIELAIKSLQGAEAMGKFAQSQTFKQRLNGTLNMILSKAALDPTLYPKWNQTLPELGWTDIEAETEKIEESLFARCLALEADFLKISVKLEEHQDTDSIDEFVKQARQQSVQRIQEKLGGYLADQVSQYTYEQVIRALPEEQQARFKKRMFSRKKVVGETPILDVDAALDLFAAKITFSPDADKLFADCLFETWK